MLSTSGYIEMSFIKIKSSEDPETDPILFPIPSGQDLNLADLRSAFPSASSLRYRDDDDTHIHHVLCRNGQFLEPDGGWQRSDRVYTAIIASGTDQSVGTSRYNQFQAFRSQLHRKSGTGGQPKSSTPKSSVPVNIRVGHGHFKSGKFSKISATSKSGCGGIVVVGPFTKEDNTAEAIKEAAFLKFCTLNRLFRQKFSSLYLCEKQNYDVNNDSIEIVTDSSSSEDLPSLFSVGSSTSKENETTLPYEDNIEPIVTVYFKTKHASFRQSFPNNAPAESLYKYLSGKLTSSRVKQLKFGGHSIQRDERLMRIFGDGQDTAEVEVIEESVTELNADENEICAEYQDENMGTVNNIVQLTLSEIGDIEEPTEILKTFCKNFLRGRQLDVTDTIEVIEGETSPIFVSRNNVMDFGQPEIISIENLRLPLKVTFYGESAEDLGGLRREFFRLYLTEMMEHLMEKSDEEWKLRHSTQKIVDRYYYAAGIVVGLSAIQGGPCPGFLFGVMQAFDDSKEEHRQFKKGVMKTGIWQMIQQKTTLKYLFMPRQNSLTVQKLLHLLQPVFAERGSNLRTFQEQQYSHFVTYIRDVAGRRNSITLGSVLKFTTGSDEEPILGFSRQPNIEFCELSGNLPTASTCIYTLNLPMHHGLTREELFKKYDYAFITEYFGLA